MAKIIEVPVLVVGGGPVGMSMAIALRHFSIPCMSVERLAGPFSFPKGRAVGIRTMEIFRQWGLESRVTEAGLAREESLFLFLGETLLGHRYQRIGSMVPWTQNISPTDRIICSQEILETILVSQAKNAGADVRFSTQLVSFFQDSHGVTAQLVDSTGEQITVHCSWLVAADGARSQIRSALGIGLQGPGTLGNSVSILIEADIKRQIAGRESALYAVNQPRPGSMFVAVDNNQRWLLQLPRLIESESPNSFTNKKCLALVRAALGNTHLPIRLLGHQLWQPTAQYAETFQQDRVFLIGDAAHVTTPSGGLGMNCGIADAHNLAWKLAGVLQGWASPTLLKSYDQERRPAAQATVEASMIIGVQARDFIAHSIEDRQSVQNRHSKHNHTFTTSPFGRGNGIALGLTYSSDAIVNDGSAPPDVIDPIFNYVPSGRPGHRAPHVWLEHDGHRISTLDLFGHNFALLIDATTEEDISSAELLKSVGNIPLRVYALGPSAAFSDLQDHWRLAYGLERGGQVLVRPDGYVCWRSSQAQANGYADVAQALKAITAFAETGH